MSYPYLVDNLNEFQTWLAGRLANEMTTISLGNHRTQWSYFSGKPCLISTIQRGFNWKHCFFMFFLVDFSGKVIASLPERIASQVPHYQHWLKPPSNTWKAICSRQLDDLDIYVPISRFLTHLDIYFLSRFFNCCNVGISGSRASKTLASQETSAGMGSTHPRMAMRRKLGKFCCELTLW